MFILDHFVMNERLLDKIIDCGVIHLGDNPSRHSPIVLKLDLGSLPVKLEGKNSSVKKPAWYKASDVDKEEFTDVDVDEMLEDVEHLRNEFDEKGNICFKYCSKRKINSISDMTDVLLDKELGDEIKKSNPSKFRYIKELLKPYRKSIRKLRDSNVDIHEKRKLLQKPDVGEGLLESVESVVTPLLKKKRK